MVITLILFILLIIMLITHAKTPKSTLPIALLPSLIFAIFFTYAVNVLALDAPTLIDINTSPNGLSFNKAIQLGSKFVMATDRDDVGTELFASENGVVSLVADINPGIEGSGPAGFVPLGGSLQGKALFSAYDPSHGTELWITDGTSAGTQLAADIVPGPNGSNVELLTATNPPSARAIFSAYRSDVGTEPFIYNNGTVSAINVNPGTSGSVSDSTAFYSIPNQQKAVANLFVLGKGQELAVLNLDALSSTTIEICAGTSAGFPGGFAYSTALNLLFFAATDCSGSIGRELFKSGLTALSTTLLADINSGSSSSSITFITPVGNSVLFSAYTPSLGQELYISDGTTSGTTILRDINIGGANGVATSTQKGILRLNDNLAVFVGTENGFGEELYVTDKTNIGTTRLTDIAPNAQGSNPRFLSAMPAQRAVFIADDPIMGSVLYVTDGTVLGTTLLKDFVPGNESERVERVFVKDGIARVSVLSSLGRQLWQTDGTLAGTTLQAQLDAGGTTDSLPSNFASGHTGFFTAYRNLDGTELWHTDGTSAGTRLIRDIEPGKESSNPSGFTELGGITYFSATTSAQGNELWRTDGTLSGTRFVRDLAPGSAGTNISGLAAVNGRVLFYASLGGIGFELFASDGSEGGTGLVADIFPGSSSSVGASSLVSLGNKAVFVATNGTSGREFYVTDGTALGTQLLTEVLPGSSGIAVVNNAIAFKNRAYFLIQLPGSGSELWNSDGSPAGTQRLKSFPDSSGYDAYGLTATDNFLFFRAKDGAHGTEIWRTDGTPGGTQIFFDSASGPLDGSASIFAALGSRLILTFTDSVVGRELFSTPEASLSLTLLKDVNPGIGNSYAYNPYVAHGRAFFSEQALSSGDPEPWSTDGTPAGTQLISDIIPGAEGSNPQSFSATRTHAIFSARDELAGYELFTILIDACPDDAAKDRVGICGCGVADVDLNANGVFDCQVNPELKLLLAELKLSFSKVKLPKTNKQRKAVNKAKAKTKSSLIRVQAYINSHSNISVQGGKSLVTLLSSLKRAVTKANKLKVRSFKKDKNSANRALKLMQNALL